MNIKKINLIVLALCISNTYNTAYKATRPQLIRKIAMPKMFTPYKTTLPLSVPQINSLLLKQTPQIQNKISNHPFFKDLVIEINQVPNIEITKPMPINFNENTLLKLEIFMHCMNHPEEAEEIMNFYQEMRDADHLIKERLELLPPHAQEFFKQQLEKYLDSKTEYNQDINPIKAKILKLYPYVIIALMHAFSVIIITSLILSNEELDPKNSEEKQLLEIFEILTNALDLEPINLSKYKSNYILRMLRGDNFIAGYNPAINLIILDPSFFKYKPDAQVSMLLHELRHYQQASQIIIPKDVIEYAKRCGVKEYSLNFLIFFMTGWFWSTALLEFDADLFMARQMKDYKWMNTLVQEIGWDFFDPKEGYFSKNMFLKESQHANKYLVMTYLEKKWDQFINSQPNENIYLQYVPQHLQEAAVKNKDAREEKKQRLKEAKQLFEEYREF